MEGLVLDCSVVVPWYLEDEATEFTDELLGQVGRTPVVVPALWRLEIVNALHIAERRRRISGPWRDRAVSHAAGLPFDVDLQSIPIGDLSALAIARSLTPYDAVYFELARRRRLPLATLDADLVRAAREAGLPLVTDLTRFPEPTPPKPAARRRRS